MYISTPRSHLVLHWYADEVTLLIDVSHAVFTSLEPEENIVKFRAVNPRRTKGSLIVSFNLFGTSFMIINSHFEGSTRLAVATWPYISFNLAGHSAEGRVSRRMNFQNTITKSTMSGKFSQWAHPHLFVDLSLSHAAVSHSSESLARVPSVDSVPRAVIGTAHECPALFYLSPCSISDKSKAFDCVLWAGDMNFRVDSSYEDVVKHCEKENYHDILLKDEFRLLQKNHREQFLCTSPLILLTDCLGDPYGEFKEAEIKFPPTYKFDLRTDDDVYAKHRTPSYTVSDASTLNEEQQRMNSRISWRMVPLYLGSYSLSR